MKVVTSMLPMPYQRALTPNSGWGDSRLSKAPGMADHRTIPGLWPTHSPGKNPYSKTFTNLLEFGPIEGQLLPQPEVQLHSQEDPRPRLKYIIRE